MARPGPGRLVLGVALGAAAGAGLGLLCLKRLRRHRRGSGWGAEQEAAAGSWSQVVPRAPDPVAGPAGAVCPPLLGQEEQAEVLESLDLVLKSIAELRREVEELRGSLQCLAAEIVGEVRAHLEETQKGARRRRFPFPRERSDSTGSSSIYFTASSGAANTDDAESEGGYSTANAESDCDREREEGEDEGSCEALRTAGRDCLELVSEDDTHLGSDSSLEEGLGQLLQQADRLHSGDEQERREGLQLLLNNKLVHAEQEGFLWHLAQGDGSDLARGAEERTSLAPDGKEELEAALQK